MSRKVLLINGVVVLLLSGLLSCLWTVLLNRSSGRIVQSWEQPDHLDYWRKAKYSLYVREKASDWYLLGGRQRRHELFIGWSKDYGHWFDCSIHSGCSDDEQIDAYIRRSKVDWTEEGVSFTQESGHKVFFPKETFIGGR